MIVGNGKIDAREASLLPESLERDFPKAASLIPVLLKADRVMFVKSSAYSACSK